MIGLILLSHAAQAVDVPVTFKVLAKSVPDGDLVYITGNHPLLGDWDTDAVPLQKQKDGSWTRTLALPAGATVEYKITRGDWSKEAVGENNLVPDNTSLKVSKAETIVIKVPAWSDTIFQGQKQVTGRVVYHRNVQGDGIQPRDVAVWLPPGYESATNRRYPVLYMCDGQNAFDPVTSFAGADWQVDEEADRLIRDGTLQDIIVVAAYNTPDREAEYGLSPKGDLYRRFVVEKLKPLMDGTYRTDGTNGKTAVMGSSMGGLCAFLLAWEYPDVFGQASCLSPAFFTNAVQMVAMDKNPPLNLRLYIDNGGLGVDVKLQSGCDAMLAVLRKKGFKDGQNLEWFCDPKAEHNERAWSRRVYRPLLFMFRKK